MFQLVGWAVERRNLWDTRVERRLLAKIKQLGQQPVKISAVTERRLDETTWSRIYGTVFPSRWRVPSDHSPHVDTLTNLKALPDVHPFITSAEALELIKQGKGDRIYLDITNDSVEWRMRNGR